MIRACAEASRRRQPAADALRGAGVAERLRRRLIAAGLWLAGALLLLGLFQWEAMHALDLRLAAALQSRQITLSDRIVIVDLPGGDDVLASRRHLARLLEQIAANQTNLPERIGVDIWFARDSAYESSIPALLKSLDGMAAIQPPVPVVGVFNVLEDGRFDPDYARRHDERPYAHLDAVGHNWYHAPTGLIGGWPFYEACDVAGLRSMPALLSASRLCDQPGGRLLRIPIGERLARTAPGQIVGFGKRPDCASGWSQADGRCLAQAPLLRNKLVIVGRLDDDQPFRSGPFAAYSGPEIVAWATSDLLAGITQPLVNNPWVQIAVALATALLGWLLFWGLLRFARRWRLTPWKLAVVAFALGLLLPALVFTLFRLSGQIYAQLLLPTLLLAWTLALACALEIRRQRVAQHLQDATTEMETVAYDVFLSYRHTYADWVEQVLQPALAQIRGSDGRPLAVFRDTQGLQAGQDWALRLGRAIQESRVFLAVITPDYFLPNASGHRICKWEMQQALQRRAQEAMAIVPILHGGYDPEQDTPPDVPGLKYIQGLATGSSDFIETLGQRILQAMADQERTR